MIVLAAAAVLLPFAAALIGMIFGPTISHLLTPLARRLRRGRARARRRGAPARWPGGCRPTARRWSRCCRSAAATVSPS